MYHLSSGPVGTVGRGAAAILLPVALRGNPLGWRRSPGILLDFIDRIWLRTYLGLGFSMGRYYIVLQASAEEVPYVVGEVVREHDDDGRHREVSLAANLAGPQALICTDEELELTEVGRSLLRRWRAGNDRSFLLDTLRMGLPANVEHPSGRFDHLTSAERDDLHAHIATRCEAVRRHGELIRQENERLLVGLRAHLEQLRENRLRCRTTLAFAGAKTGREPRRHLRSVS